MIRRANGRTQAAHRFHNKGLSGNGKQALRGRRGGCARSGGAAGPGHQRLLHARLRHRFQGDGRSRLRAAAGFAGGGHQPGRVEPGGRPLRPRRGLVQPSPRLGNLGQQQHRHPAQRTQRQRPVRRQRHQELLHPRLRLQPPARLALQRRHRHVRQRRPQHRLQGQPVRRVPAQRHAAQRWRQPGAAVHRPVVLGAPDRAPVGRRVAGYRLPDVQGLRPAGVRADRLSLAAAAPGGPVLGGAG